MNQITEGYIKLDAHACRPCAKCKGLKNELRAKGEQYQIICLDCGHATDIHTDAAIARLQWREMWFKANA